MVLQMAQKGALWPNVMTTFGPCWCKVKLSWDIANVSSTIGCWQPKMYININVIHCMVQLKLDWLSYSSN